MLYAVIETNVLVSALLKMDSNPGKVLSSIVNGETFIFVNEEILLEYKKVLSRDKFHFPPQMIEDILRQLEYKSKFTSIESKEYLDVNDPKDRCFYAVTLSGRESVDALLVTGNICHFPEEQFIVTPSQFVNILEVERNKQLE